MVNQTEAFAYVEGEATQLYSTKELDTALVCEALGWPREPVTLHKNENSGRHFGHFHYKAPVRVNLREFHSLLINRKMLITVEMGALNMTRRQLKKMVDAEKDAQGVR